MNDLVQAIRTIPDFPQPGIQFKDITPLLADSDLLVRTADALAEIHDGLDIDKVIGIEARGFIFAALLAERLDAGFIPVRKQGKLPAACHAEAYALEYGTATIEMHRDAVEPGERVLIHDDVLATGGTAMAAMRLVEQAGGELAGLSFLIEITALDGRKLLEGCPVHALIQV